MTNYGTIPTSPSHASPVVDLESDDSSHPKQRIKPCRPWRVMFDFNSMRLPPCSLSRTFTRIKTNLGYFHMNYVIVVLIIILILIFKNLINRPIPLIFFSVLVFVWFLYFHFDVSSKLFRYYQFVDWMVKFCLMLVTITLLMLTHASSNMFLSLLIGAVLVLVHAVVRKTDDLFLDEEAATTETSWKLDSLDSLTLALLFSSFASS